MNITAYLEEIRAVHATRKATEHSYRPALETLFKSIDPAIEVINEPKRSEGGMPDFLFQRQDVPFGWCEAKDLDKDIFKLKGYSKEQRKRYEDAYPNLIYTNGVDFEFIRDGQSAYHISIASFMGQHGGLQPHPEQFERLESLLRDFVDRTPVTVKNAEQLAKLMAAKAKIIKEEVGIALEADTQKESDLYGQLLSFKDNLLPNVTEGEFADLYAETITYGMFAARYNDPTIPTFSRAEALQLIPATNPFLRALFNHIAGADLEKRLRHVLDDLVALFLAATPHELFEDFGKWTARNDPFVHFYENFLGAYNPKKRKSRGVWYTPEPVVDFIVRAVDDVLKSEFNIADGLASTAKIEQGDHSGEHKVQILDPATGTGTFLSKVVEMIHADVAKAAPSAWQNYVEKDLIPRLHGFELLMASYTMCHLKLDLMLRATGYKPAEDAKRLSVWLTNTLEPADEDIGPLFFQALRKEAQGASMVKNKTPIMCIIGNPPYAVSSNNKGAFIEELVADYKKDLNERNIQPLSDDYIKFLRYSQYLIEKNGEGVLGFITNNSYLDGLIHRQMRKDMLRAFDSIYVIDLHGSSKKQERAPDGSADKNVFDIMQGVSIIIAVKKKGATVTGKSSGASSTVTPAKAGVQKTKKLDSRLRGNDEQWAKVQHLDLWGNRKSKNNALFETALNDKKFQTIETPEPNHYFVPKDFAAQAQYEEGFSIDTLLIENNSGIKTHKDSFAISHDSQEMWSRIKDVKELNPSDLRSKYTLGKDVRDWKVEYIQSDISKNYDESYLIPINYRPFDTRWTYYTGRTKGFMSYPRQEIMHHMLDGENFCILLKRSRVLGEHQSFKSIGVADTICDLNFFGDQSYCFPLYLYPEEGSLDQNIRLNFDPTIYAEIRAKAGLSDAPFNGNNEGFRNASGDDRPDEIKLFDYIYGVLHSPEYRETYKEFLKIDFPRIPYPHSPESFADISAHGEALRRLHLMEDSAIGEAPYPFLGDPPEDMDSIVDKIRYEDGKVYINGKNENGQYFDNVPLTAWEFYIGGYQPAQKWLKDRKERKLEYDELRHYQKIIKILCETDRIMQQIKIPMD